MENMNNLARFLSCTTGHLHILLTLEKFPSRNLNAVIHPTLTAIKNCTVYDCRIKKRPTPLWFDKIIKFPNFICKDHSPPKNIPTVCLDSGPKSERIQNNECNLTYNKLVSCNNYFMIISNLWSQVNPT